MYLALPLARQLTAVSLWSWWQNCHFHCLCNLVPVFFWFWLLQIHCPYFHPDTTLLFCKSVCLFWPGKQCTCIYPSTCEFQNWMVMEKTLYRYIVAGVLCTKMQWNLNLTMTIFFIWIKILCYITSPNLIFQIMQFNPRYSFSNVRTFVSCPHQ